MLHALGVRPHRGRAGPGLVGTGPGHPVLHDEDRAWLAATRHACSAHDLATAGFWVVTRYGWLDPVSGDSRTWKRLRIAR